MKFFIIIFLFLTSCLGKESKEEKSVITHDCSLNCNIWQNDEKQIVVTITNESNINQDVIFPNIYLYKGESYNGERKIDDISLDNDSLAANFYKIKPKIPYPKNMK